MKNIIVFAAFISLLFAGPAVAGPDEDAVTHLLKATFDKPEARLVVDPVVVAGDHAIAGWSLADMGGRALLRRKGGTWSLILCGGDAIRSAEALRHAGVRAADAALLAGKLTEAEARLSPERRALLAKFDGILEMQADGSHPPVKSGGHGSGHHE